MKWSKIFYRDVDVVLDCYFIKNSTNRLERIYLSLLVLSCLIMSNLVYAYSEDKQNSLTSKSQDSQTISDALAINLNNLATVQSIFPLIKNKRVIYVGEQHDRYDNHLVQLEVIKRLYKHNSNIAIGMEMFQKPTQVHIDDYIAGKISEYEMLSKAKYFELWGFDYRMYAPILRFARMNHIPIIALNVSRDITSKVSRVGINGLAVADKKHLPSNIDFSDTGYKNRLKQIYQLHPKTAQHNFDNFYEAQLVWDETMAETAAEYLKTHTKEQMVILAGNGHLAYRSGIPQRLYRRLNTSEAVIINSWKDEIVPELADYVIFPERIKLPAKGSIGAELVVRDGGLYIKKCIKHSPCETNGLEKSDKIVSINNNIINSLSDLHLQLWDKKSKDTISVEVERTHWFMKNEKIRYNIQLQ